MKTAAPIKLSVRQRLLDAAEALFYSEGIHAVGIERVLAQAGVAKASLYATFGSKDALVAAYLERRHLVRQARLAGVIEQGDTPRARILGMFDDLARSAARPGFRGCPFARVGVEAEPGSAVRGVCDSARNWVHAQLREQAALTGAPAPEQLARQLLIVYDGAAVSASLDGAAQTAAAARKMAALLLDNALTPAPG